VDEATIAARRAAMDARGAQGWKPTEKRQRLVSTALRAYAAFALSASEGAARDVDQFERGVTR
jgi:dihydroxy-acid dehydratase